MDTTRLCCSGRVCEEGLQIEEVTLRSETIFENLISVLCISDSGVGSRRSEKDHSVF